MESNNIYTHVLHFRCTDYPVFTISLAFFCTFQYIILLCVLHFITREANLVPDVRDALLHKHFHGLRPCISGSYATPYALLYKAKPNVPYKRLAKLPNSEAMIFSVHRRKEMQIFDSPKCVLCSYASLIHVVT